MSTRRCVDVLHRAARIGKERGGGELSLHLVRPLGAEMLYLPYRDERETRLQRE